MENNGVFYEMKDKRQHKCTTPDCRGVVYIEGDKVKCTDCSMIVKAKRDDDKELKPLLILRTEFNG